MGQRNPNPALTALRWACLLGGAGQSLAGAGGALLAEQVGGSASFAGLPQAVLVAGAAGAAMVSGGVTRRHGRRVALGSGAAVAVLGCVGTVLGGVGGSLGVVLLGNLLLGAGNTAVMLGRYAAADLVAEADRPRAMGSALSATTVGAVVSPNLLRPSSDLGVVLGLPPLVGAYLVAGVCFAAACRVLFRLPAARPVIEDAPGGRMPGDAVLGIAVLATANLVMVAVMTMAPPQLHHMHTGLALIGVVISAHIAGMFGPSPLSARVTARLGAGRAAVLAGGLLVLACAVAAAGSTTPGVLLVGMVLLGLGWNLALLAGSALLTAGASAAQRPRREAWGEVGMGVAAMVGGAGSGVLVQVGGYPSLAVTGALVASLLVFARPGVRYSQN